MYSMKILYYLSALSTLLLLAGGCSGGDDPDVEDQTGSVTLMTRGDTDATTTYRLLVFKDADGTCLKNINFGYNSDKLQLPSGTYKFVTLTEPVGTDLPAPGTIAGLTLSTPITVDGTVPLKPLRISNAEAVVIPATKAYVAELKPATCNLILNISGNEAEKATYTLASMYNNISLNNGSFNGSLNNYPLQSGTNICLPTNGNAELNYKLNSTSPSTIPLGFRLEAGYTYTVNLAYSDGVISLKTTVKTWDDGGSQAGSAE